jgi:hypothetical protein
MGTHAMSTQFCHKIRYDIGVVTFFTKQLLLSRSFLLKSFSEKAFGRTSQKMKKLELKYLKELYQTDSY